MACHEKQRHLYIKKYELYGHCLEESQSMK